MTEKSIPRKIRLQERAAEVEEHLRGAGGKIQVTDLERQIRRGLLGLLKVFRRNNITIHGFLRLYPERFTTRSGLVSVKDSVDPPAPTPTPEVSFAEQIALSDARNAMLKAARKERSKERLRGVAATYGRGPPT